MRFLVYEDLAAKGVHYSRSQIWRLKKLPAGNPRKFPDPVRGLGRADSWAEAEIDRYVARQLAARDSEAA
jgi:predicted DNA-binding transcriptional regulator AlpA